MKKSLIALALVISAVFLARATKPASPQVKLYWDASVSPGITNYVIYWGEWTGNYTNSMSAGTNLNCVVTTLITWGKTYYFAATAQDNSGVESDYSNELKVVIPLAPGPPIHLRGTP